MIEVVTDHKPLVTIYNDPGKPKQLHLDRHCTKLLPYQYHVIYKPGSKTSSNYGSSHPQIHAYSDKITEAWGVENATDIYVNIIIDDLLPKAITIPMIQTELQKDQILLDLKKT